jgi:phosphate transport system substrate-binding protein
VGCQEQRERGSTTRGSVTIECDESVLPAMELQRDDFQRTYTDAHVDLRVAEAREAVADFFNDSVRVIVIGRELNKEERDALAVAKVDIQEFKVALGGVAVIVNKSNPLDQLRVGQLDSIFTGMLTQWPGTRNTIQLAVGNVNSSTDEVFRKLVLKGKPFGAEATPFSSSKRLVEFVRDARNAVGIVGLGWLRGGMGQQVGVVAVGDPNSRPDSTRPMGEFYKPYQAYIYKGYYPISRPVYMYSRELSNLTVGYGFIAYVSSAQGQQIFLSNGLVPVTMPVRIVNLTSEQVKPR